MEDNHRKESFLSRVPGFRSGKTWKKGIASIGYLFAILIFIGLFTDNANNNTASTQSTGQEQQLTPDPIDVNYLSNRGCKIGSVPIDSIHRN